MGVHENSARLVYYQCTHNDNPISAVFDLVCTVAYYGTL